MQLFKSKATFRSGFFMKNMFTKRTDLKHEYVEKLGLTPWDRTYICNNCGYVYKHEWIFDDEICESIKNKRDKILNKLLDRKILNIPYLSIIIVNIKKL